MGQPAARGAGCHRRQPLIGRPEGKQRVAGELDDITAVVDDQLDQSAKATVQQLGQLFDTARPTARQPLGQGREARDVREQHRRGQSLAFRLMPGLLAAHHASGGQRRHVAGERERLVAVTRLFHVLPSQP
jgi:hypothetical protein